MLTLLHRQLLSLMTALPPLSPLARASATWTSPDAMAASLAAYESWAGAVRNWHAELEAQCRALVVDPSPATRQLPNFNQYKDLSQGQSTPNHDLQQQIPLRELESSLLDLSSTTWLSTPYSQPFTLAAAEPERDDPSPVGIPPKTSKLHLHEHLAPPQPAPITPTTLHAYLVNEVTPNYRRFRALAECEDGVSSPTPTPAAKGKEKDTRADEPHPPLDALGSALDELLACHVLPHIAPGHSSNVASVSFLQFVVHELLPSWVRFRAWNADAIRRAVYGDEVVMRLVESLEGVYDSSVRCGCHPQATIH